MKNNKKIKTKSFGYWTKEMCINDALKYSSRSEWSINSGSAYNSASKNGWKEECCIHMKQIKNPPGYWTKERCIEYASKYSWRTEWSNQHNISYSTAVKRKWLDECCTHMRKKFTKTKFWTKQDSKNAFRMS